MTARSDGLLSIANNHQVQAGWIINLGENKKPWGLDTRVVSGDNIPKAAICVAHLPHKSQ